MPLYRQIVSINAGFLVKFHGADDETLMKGILLCGVADVPARNAFMNLKGHMGYESCTKCFIYGEKSAATGNVMVFPHEDRLVLRDDVSYDECVSISIETKTAYKGACGPTILFYMIWANFIHSICIDSMHALFWGITKQLLKLWFDTKYSTEPFSLVDKTNLVNTRLKSFQFPNFVQRLPDDVTKLKF